MASYRGGETGGQDARTIGIPPFSLHEIMPFWKTFFTALGFAIGLLRQDQQTPYP